MQQKAPSTSLKQNIETMTKKTQKILSFAVIVFLLGMIGLQSCLSLLVKQWIYTIGLLGKNIIMMVLPVVIFGMIFRSSSTMAHNARTLLTRLIFGVTVSTLMAIFIGSGIGFSLYHVMKPLDFPSNIDGLNPLFIIQDMTVIKNEWALIIGLLLGIILGKKQPNMAKKIASITHILVQYALKVIRYAMPFFIFGFIIKIAHEGIITLLLKKYTVVFSTIILSTTSYLIFIYLALSQFSFSNAFRTIRNILPAAISGMTTMSSATSLPFLVQGVEKNTGNKNLAEFASPIVVNVHMIGECLANIILAYSILKTYNIDPPTIKNFFIFSFFFFLTRFSCAGIPGGGTLITMPLFKKYFSFDNEMVSLLTALNLFLDPFITWGNILGDGALCQWMTQTDCKKKQVYDKRR